MLITRKLVIYSKVLVAIPINFVYELLTCFKKGGWIKQCSVCNKRFLFFRPFGEVVRFNAQCPKCGSLERHRAMWPLIQENLKTDKRIRVLHVAPEKCFYNVFKNNSIVDYYPVDINPHYPGIRDVVDITNIKYDKSSFDLIICNHVLEHVSDDMKAMQEFHRVLKSDGVAVLNVPIDYSRIQTFEDQSINTPKLRRKYYGQSDHLRVYGQDYLERLKQNGFFVRTMAPNTKMNELELRVKGVDKCEEVFLCTK